MLMMQGLEIAKIVFAASSLMAAIIGGLMVFIPLSSMRKKKARCTQPVRVVCTQLEEIGGYVYTEPVDQSLMSQTMKPRLEGDLNGHPVIIENNVYSLPHPQIGDTMDILVNPDDYNDYRDPKKSNLFSYLIIGFGAIVMIAGLFQLVVATIAFTSIDNNLKNSSSVVETDE